MLTRRLLIFFQVLCLWSIAANAQRPKGKSLTAPTRAPGSNFHRKYIPVRAGSYRFDSLSVIPASFHAVGIPDSNFVLDFVNASISWKKTPNLDSVVVSYRSFPVRLNAVTKRLNYDSIENNFLIQPFVFNNGFGQDNDNFFNFGNINYNGSFGRGLSFGNSQDAVVTSNLNLQLSGYLADSIEISAAITDNNIPIQPDGTTAELNEFDKIFLQFKKRDWALSLGDIDLRQNQNYFLSFYKRLQGASFETTTRVGTKFTNKAMVSGAIAKGKFTRNIFQGLEGNQGPYRLQGANNEFYFVVLAGTEKVFIDGMLMQRGEDQDYVINYNTAEVTFTPKRLITKDTRIQVEFEYADRNYLNVNLYLYDEANFSDKLKVRVGVFSNSDSRNSPINQTLDDNQKKFLNGIGDSINKAFYPVATLDTFSVGKILYLRKDTSFILPNGGVVHDSVYYFPAEHPDSGKYSLSFTNVGSANGDYVPDLNGANGSVYKWVAPVNGVKQGQYEAAQFLVTPKTQQVITIGADYALTKNTLVSGELARSHYDVNTLSSKDKGNDNGIATRLMVHNDHPFLHSARDLKLTTNISYEHVNINFQPVERLRTVEFTRDWGLPLQVNPDNESLVIAGFKLSDKKGNSLKYEFSNYDRGTSFTGIRNSVIHFQDFGGWRLSDQFIITNSNSTTDKGYFWRPTIDLSKQFEKLGNYTVGATYSVEHNESHDKVTDSVAALSYSFQTLQAYLKSPDKNPNHWGLNFFTRTDAYPSGKALVNADRSLNLNAFVELTKNIHHQLRFNATYRNLRIIDSTVTSQQADNSLLARAEYVINEWKGLLIGNALYEVGSGQEQKRSYSYIQVPAGTGQYTWLDLNNDGIQQLNEFVLAAFPDQATYIRVFTPTNEFIKANYNTFNYSISLNPRAVITPANNTGIRKFISRLFFQSSLQLNQKVEANGFVQLNPFKTPINDTSLITQTSIFVNTLSFNKSSPKWGFDLTTSRNGGKSLLTYGYESRLTTDHTLRARYSISRSVLFNANFSKGNAQLISSSKNFDNSNYVISQYAIEPTLTYTRKANLRILFGYKYNNKLNAPDYGGDKYSSHAVNTEFKYNILQSTSIQAKFTFSDISYQTTNSSGTNSPVAYIILDGLVPGKNYLWNIDFTKKLGGSLELNIQYEGRKPGDTRVIHTGRASLRALL